jgi:hypothetical protein
MLSSGQSRGNLWKGAIVQRADPARSTPANWASACRLTTSNRNNDTMTIEGPGGETLTTVKKALISPLRDRWTVKVGNGPDLQVQGNILNHQYTIGEGNNKVAEVSKRWFRL